MKPFPDRYETYPRRTFHPKGQLSITLTVAGGLGLDTIAGTGYLEVGVSTTYVSRLNFRIFNAGD